jgi:hypothetical protein
MNNQQKSKQNFQLALSLGIGFAGGLLSGVLGGILVSNRVNSARRMPFANVWERSMAQERGHVQASYFVNRVESRYWELFCQRPRLVSQPLRDHLNNNILPGLALYQILLEDGLDQNQALANVDHLINISSRSERKPLEILARLPFFYQILRFQTPRTLEQKFPVDGWDIEWIENSPHCVAFNMHSCFYLDTLTGYGMPELTLVYCKMDDRMFDGLSPYVRWERSGTLARGDEMCDFRWTRVSKPKNTGKLVPE